MKKIFPSLIACVIGAVGTYIYMSSSIAGSGATAPNDSNAQTLNSDGTAHKCELKNDKCYPYVDTDPDITNEAWASCDHLGFDQMTETDLIQFVGNYRDVNWKESSALFDSMDYKAAEIQEIMRSTRTGAPLLDARFMEVSLDELDNYLCVLKSLDTSNKPHGCPELLRFYYTRYDKGKTVIGAPGFAGRGEDKHSLAIVPVDIVEKDHSTCKQELITIDWTAGPESVIFSVENYNDLCPPMSDCYNATRVYADKPPLPGSILEASDAKASGRPARGCK